jgi:hypothetical protein
LRRFHRIVTEFALGSEQAAVGYFESSVLLFVSHNFLKSDSAI